MFGMLIYLSYRNQSPRYPETAKQTFVLGQKVLETKILFVGLK